MNNHRSNNTVLRRGGWLRFCLALLAMLFSCETWSAYQDIGHGAGCLQDSDAVFDDTNAVIFYIRNGTTSATPISDHCGPDCDIETSGFPSANVIWSFTDIDNFGQPACSDASGPTISCGGLNITLPSGTVPKGDKAILTGFNDADLPSVQNKFRLTVTDAGPGGTSCRRRYIVLPHATLGGWGDPHITTVDGVRYDFQSAGEFISLRGNGVEIQTRQTAVSTPNINFTNGYTGLRNCVSLYTAVALRVGPHRVTIQPNISGIPDPEGLQIRVDGDLKTLGPGGIDLSSSDCPSTEIQRHGRIVRAWDEKSIEIHYANGTKVLVTPAWWANQQKWYLNINVYDTAANEGIMGRITEGWLPTLSNGSTVGPKAADMHERYVQLYETFADSWRVTNANSLFDYASGTSTATFTLAEWPREDPSSCLLEGEPVAEPVDEAVAEEACMNVVDPNNRENCIFDVSATGHTGFADAYERSEQLIPGATRTTLTADKEVSTPGVSVTFTANVKRAVSTIGKLTSGRVQFALNGSNVGSPEAFDDNGDAIWSTSDLQSGNHVIEAQFLPSTFGEPLRASSGTLNHKVCMFSIGGKCITDKWWFWLLVILLILFLLWKGKRFLPNK